MTSLWFVVPVHGRVPLASICLRQLSRTCESLRRDGVIASAVLVGSRSDLTRLPRLGFAEIERDNTATSLKFNDGIQFATDPRYNPHPADYVVPCGSDDWVDHRLFLEPLPDQDTIQGFQRISVVREDGREMSTIHLDYRGGAGIRIIPRQLVAPLGYRPADEDRRAGCDTSILTNLYRVHGGHLRVHDTLNLHDHQIVDWKTHGQQLNGYDQILYRHRAGEPSDPFVTLRGVYPDDALDEMQAHYEKVTECTAVTG